MSDAAAPARAAASPEVIAAKYMVHAYENWAKAEGPPVHEAPWFDLNAVATGPWPRLGVDGAFCHLTGRCDYLAMWLLDIPTGRASAFQHHLFDSACVVVSGHGTATIEGADGSHRSEEHTSELQSH